MSTPPCTAHAEAGDPARPPVTRAAHGRPLRAPSLRTRPLRTPALQARALRAALALAGAACLAALPACAGRFNPAGTDEYAYNAGQLTSQVADTLDRTLHATVAAAEQSGLVIRQRERGEGWARLVAEQGDGKDVKIRLRRLAPALTEIQLRVGLIGDEPQSRAIFDRIRNALAVSP